MAKEKVVDIKNNEDHDAILRLQIKDENREKHWKIINTVCITSTTALFSFFIWLGHIVYEKYPAFKAAIITFIQTDKGIK